MPSPTASAAFPYTVGYGLSTRIGSVAWCGDWQGTLDHTEKIKANMWWCTVKGNPVARYLRVLVAEFVGTV